MTRTDMTQTEMALAAVLSDDGQVTLPDEVRQALGARPGDRLTFTVSDDGTVVLERRHLDVRSLAGALREYALPQRSPPTPAEMTAAVADEVADAFARSVR